MGLFFNKKQHPDVFKNIGKIDENNQIYVRHNALTELIDEQQKVNMNLEKSIAELKPRYDQLEEMQTSQWNNVKEKINDLMVSSNRHEQMERIVISRINTLDENGLMLKKSMIEQMNNLKESYQKILSRMEKNESSYEYISTLMNKQIDLQEEVTQTLLKHEEFHTGVLNRLDNQEALTEKISRQLSNIRSILFERTNYIATKLEDGFKQTSSYVYKLMNGNDKPTFTTVLDNKKKQNQSNAE